MKLTKSKLKQIIKEELSKAGAYEALKNAFTAAGYEYLEKESQAGPDEWGFGLPHLSFTKPGTKNPYDGNDIAYPPIIQITVDEEVGKMYAQLLLRAPESAGERAGNVLDKRPAGDGGYYRGHKDAIDLSDFDSLKQRIDQLFQGIPQQVARRVDSEAEAAAAAAAAERGVGDREWSDLEEKKMRLTKSKLKQVIKEELSKALNEIGVAPGFVSREVPQEIYKIVGSIVGLIADTADDAKKEAPYLARRLGEAFNIEEAIIINLINEYTPREANEDAVILINNIAHDIAAHLEKTRAE
jgi:hypothetical protein